MPFIIGTAGHIDHGKTSLVKALTGEDTDRLKEEKERGISIDLGFAHFDLPDGSRAGLVDVPGHERFIRNMLAGAHGIDLVLFTVAADDGVMPQTEEHLDILHLLDVRRAIFVITKADLASKTRLAEVDDQIQALISGTTLEGSRTMPFSFVTGEGLDQLRAAVVEELQRQPKPTPGGYFRLPVDRVFVLQGHGVVVTGTALAGEVKVGDRLRCLPGEQVFRVRSVQVHNQPVNSATWGQRTALNLSGTEKPEIERGDVLCDEHIADASERFDTSLEVRPLAPELKNHQRVRVHLGTAERMGKVVILESDQPARPGTSVFAQIVLTEPVLMRRGDHFILRDETAQRTIAGGTVLHPWARPHRRREPGLAIRLRTLSGDDLASLVALYLNDQDDFAIPLAPIVEFLNLRTEQLAPQMAQIPAVRPIALEGELLYTTHEKWQRLADVLQAELERFHQAQPLAPGRDLEALREHIAGGLSPKLFRAVLDDLERAGVVSRDGSLLRLARHRVTLKPDEQRRIDQILTLLGTTPLSPPDLGEIERQLDIKTQPLIALLRVLEANGVVVRVSNELYFLKQSLDAVKHTLTSEFAKNVDITPAMFRDRFSTTRKYTIPLLGHLDREGVTMRIGDVRRLR